MLPDHRPIRNVRQCLHVPPTWVADDSTFFITINCRERGRPQLVASDVSSLLLQSVSYLYERKVWWPEIMLLMPDHLHALVSFSWKPGEGINRVLHNWKRYTSRNMGVVWQRDFFDHRIRGEEDHQQKWAYIRENPVRAGLVEHYSSWPHVWFPDRIGW